jgi:ABC-type branched-subunit amino acid transport system substrate-binding protein
LKSWTAARKFTAATVTTVLAAAFAAPLANAATLVVGQVGPMSGLDANQGRAYAAGMQLYFNAANKAGGVAGHTFKLVSRDDGGRPQDTVNVTRELIAQDKPAVLAGYFGTRNVVDLIGSGVLEKEKIALVGYRIAEIRPENPFVYSVRAGLRDEIGKLTEHLGTIGITKLGLFYEEGPGAATLVSAADEAAKKAHASIVAKSAYPANTAKVSPSVDAFIAAKPQAILMVSSGAAAAGFIEQYRAGGGTAQLFAHSGADIEQLSKRLSEEQMQGVAIAQVTPSPYKFSVKLTKEFNDAVAKDKPDVPVSYVMMEGYIAAKVIGEAVRRQGARASREGMQAALDAMESYDLGGYLVSYKPGAHSGSKFVELSIISGAGKIRQ